MDPRTRQLLERRHRLLGPNVPTFYREPVEIRRAEGVWMWDAAGRRYLDAYNNVPHVGHGHPRVVEAICRQSAELNTHSRYLHPLLLDYAERLTARLPEGLDGFLPTCTGSEANDVAIRMAWAATGRRGLIATDATYHGNTHLVSQLSTRRPPLGGRAPWVRLVPAPEGPGDAARFAAEVAAAAEALEAEGHGLAALVLCPFLANEGFPPVGPGFFDDAIAAVRRAGGVVIADEVQPGFGRLGRWFWGHARAGFVPDIVTLGKPMANGYPVAAVVARPELLAAFREAFGYFNTYAGNPVGMAAAMAVLDVLEAEDLPARAAATGDAAREGLEALAARHPLIAEVRGEGLFFGAVLRDPASGAPAGEAAAEVIEAMRARGVLMGVIGPANNILKIRPPLPFGREELALLLERLDEALREVEAAMGAA